jgi:rare lipoprotein A
LLAIIRIIASVFSVAEPVFSGRAVYLSGGAMRIFRRSLLLLCCLLALSACGTKKSNVVNTLGPDGKRVKASQRPYTVNGQRYEPLRSHEGFVQSGVASWYGKDFHGKKTSNGEIYDMHAMTAAHKTLPLGVYLKVSNRENGRETTVRVNDRGPFVKGRILDLSYAAAKTLGVDTVGTALVRIEALGYRQAGGKERYKEPATYDAGDYTVQVGAFKEQANAKRLSGELRKLFGFSDVRMTNVNNDLFYRVYAGKYSSLIAAEEAEKNFSEHGYPGSFAVALE